MTVQIFITKQAQKDLRKIPKHILLQLDLWVEIIKEEGYRSMQLIKGYNDHALIGDRKGQRSSYLSRSWRVIYTIDEQKSYLLIEILEINHHDY